MSICQLGMHKNVQDHTNANVCKQTYDASCRIVQTKARALYSLQDPTAATHAGSYIGLRRELGDCFVSLGNVERSPLGVATTQYTLNKCPWSSHHEHLPNGQ